MKKALFLSVMVVFCTLGCSQTTTVEQSSGTVEQPSTALPKVTQSTPEARSPEPLPEEKQILLTGGTARYLVQEQLARLNFPIDAIGETQEVLGFISINNDGTINQEESEIVVKLEDLRSDESRRDRYLRNNSLESNVYPEAVFQVKELIGFNWPELGSEKEDQNFRMLGDMTIHGVKAEIEWDVEVHFIDNVIEGQARTSFPFSKFKMEIPSLFFILSVEDEIRLELDFSAQWYPER